MFQPCRYGVSKTKSKYYQGRGNTQSQVSKPDIEAFIEQANLQHPTTEFTAETFDTETAFLDTVVYKGTRFKENSILDAKTHFKHVEVTLFWKTFAD